MTERALSISHRLSVIESMAIRGAWSDVRTSASEDLVTTGASPELLALYGESLLRCGAPREASEWFAATLDVAARSANRSAWRRSVNLAGAAAFEIGRVDEAETFFSLALELAESAHDSLLSARATNNLALVASSRAEWDAALAYYNVALAVYQRVGSVRGLAECYHNIATTMLDAGDLDGAEDAERRAIEYARDTEHPRLHAFTLAGRAEVLLRKGDAEFAQVLAEQSARSFRTLRDDAWEAHALRIVGLSQLQRGEAAGAVETTARAVSLSQSGAVARVSGDCHFALAQCQLATADKENARGNLVAAAAVFAQIGASDKLRQVQDTLASLGLGR
jgi:tetratricopeptide (TPR) repeat protein